MCVRVLEVVVVIFDGRLLDEAVLFGIEIERRFVVHPDVKINFVAGLVTLCTFYDLVEQFRADAEALVGTKNTDRHNVIRRFAVCFLLASAHHTANNEIHVEDGCDDE